MPLYVCNAKKGLLNAAAKEAIANDITNIHCSITGAPAIFVHTVFFEEALQFPLENKALFVRGTIRKGRSNAQKDEIASAINESLVQHGGVPAAQANALIRETPASWVLEGGEIMPEPGEEAEWFAAQEAKHQAKQQVQNQVTK